VEKQQQPIDSNAKFQKFRNANIIILLLFNNKIKSNNVMKSGLEIKTEFINNQ